MYCQQNHGETCNPSLLPNVSGLKVIDCETLCVVSPEYSVAYVALSYIWGNVTNGEPCKLDQLYKDNKTFENSLGLPDTLPAVIADAIKVTKSLDFRYLWVDRYCIDQDNAEEKHDQIRKMNLIYAGAHATIVAAAGKGEDYGLPGVGKRPRFQQPMAKVQANCIVSTLGHPIHAINNSKWSTRGWTYQEAVLSRRRLVFTDHQVYFECNKMNTYESFSAPLDLLHSQDKSDFHSFLRPHVFDTALGGWGPDSSSFLSDSSTLSLFAAHVENFSARELSYESDTLNAFTGIAQTLKLGLVNNPVFHLWGIPFELLYNSAKDTKKVREANVKSFVHALQWHLRDRSTKSTCRTKSARRKGFPSWSWSGWMRPVAFKSYQALIYPVFAARRGKYFVHISIELTDGSTKSLADCDEEFLNKSESQITRILHLEGWVIRFHAFGISQEQQGGGYIYWFTRILKRDLSCIILNTGPDDLISPFVKPDDFILELLIFSERKGMAYREGSFEIVRHDLRNFSMAVEKIKLC
jgi:hypothetical protein